MRLIFLGAPGVGKGTTARLASLKLDVPHISTGDIFREEIAEQTELGNKIKDSMSKGILVSDEQTIAIVKKRIAQPDCKKGFILDGFPRNIKQAEALDKMTKIDAVVDIELDEDFLIKRLLSRRVCTKCKRVYNLMTSERPKKDGICDDCGIKLIKREDDNEKVIRDRQEQYKKETKPLIDYYSKKKLLKSVDGMGTGEIVTERVLKVL